jgi:hypothetical protein
MGDAMAQDTVEPHGEEWLPLRSDDPELFSRLRALVNAEVHLRCGIGTGDGFRVEVPAASLTLRGRLSVEPVVDRLGILPEGWGAGDFVWFARRKGRGRTDYWQGAIEYRPEGQPALVLYLTAALDGLELRVRELPRS